jgi:branched-chain amino acid transport system substrate-binding protein
MSARGQQIGITADMSSPNDPLPVADDLSGAKLAIEDINAAGGVLGRSIELIAEDVREFGTTDEMQAHARATFAKLSAQADIVAFVGPAFSLMNPAMAPQVLEVGKPMMIGGTEPKLTHMGNPWLFRCRPSDTYSTKAMAASVATTLQRKRWAIIHVNDPFGLSARKCADGGIEAGRCRARRSPGHRR